MPAIRLGSESARRGALPRPLTSLESAASGRRRIVGQTRTRGFRPGCLNRGLDWHRSTRLAHGVTGATAEQSAVMAAHCLRWAGRAARLRRSRRIRRLAARRSGRRQRIRKDRYCPRCKWFFYIHERYVCMNLYLINGYFESIKSELVFL